MSSVWPNNCVAPADKEGVRKVPRVNALVYLPQTRSEVVAIDAHADPKAFIQVIENLQETVYLLPKKKNM